MLIKSLYHRTKLKLYKMWTLSIFAWMSVLVTDRSCQYSIHCPREWSEVYVAKCNLKSMSSQQMPARVYLHGHTYHQNTLSYVLRSIIKTAVFCQYLKENKDKGVNTHFAMERKYQTKRSKKRFSQINWLDSQWQKIIAFYMPIRQRCQGLFFKNRNH